MTKVHTRMHTHMHAHTCVHTRTHIHRHAHTHIHVHTNTRMRAHTHAHTYFKYLEKEKYNLIKYRVTESSDIYLISIKRLKKSVQVNNACYNDQA